MERTTFVCRGAADRAAGRAGATLAAVRHAVAIIGVIAAGAVAAQQPAPPKIEDFVREPEFSRPALSPDGRLIAALVLAGGRKQLAVIDPAALDKSRIAAAFSDADIGGFEWISDKRLVFHATDHSTGGGSQLAPGLFAVDADGTGLRQLVDRNWRGIVTGARRLGDRTLPWHTYLVGPTQDRQSDDVFVVQIPWDVTRHRPGDEAPDPVLMRLNTRTGETSNLSLGVPGGPGTFLVDEQGTPRVRVITRSGRVTVHYRDAKSDQWRVLSEFPAIGGDGFRPLRIRRDGTLLVDASNGRDTRALYVYDPSAGRIDPQAVVAVDGYDFEGTPVWELGSDRLLGVHVNADGAGTVWLDPRMKEIQKLIDGAMPGLVNRIAVPLRPATSTLLVTSFSDAQPPVYAIFDADKRTLTRFARSRPGIDPKALGRADFARVKARDGLELPLYYTVPAGAAGKGPLPTVVLLHGGPWVRGSRWEWDAEAQLLASRGYLVLEPEFRGSTGYGFRHFQAGWKQWGMAMQDDVVDVVQWAVAKGLADPKRVCVAGASYGGYATLMALARDGGTFKCGVAWAGVTDIELLFTADWTDMTESARRYGLRTLIGDPDKDAERLRAASPLANASRITQPLLLAYGAADLRVPIEHGRRFRDAVTRDNPAVEWVVYGDEGHGWTKLENRIDFWKRVEKFLATQLATTAKP